MCARVGVCVCGGDVNLDNCVAKARARRPRITLHALHALHVLVGELVGALVGALVHAACAAVTLPCVSAPA